MGNVKLLFGDPVHDRLDFERKHMILYDIPEEINAKIKVLPNKIYLNRVIDVPLTNVLRELIAKELHHEILTYDGCFNVRKSRGINALSMHSYGIAIDLNAAWNPLIRNVTPAKRDTVRKQHVKWSEAFLQVWRNNGFECGADWKTIIDGMHFQYQV